LKLLIISQYFWPENFKINDLVGELVARGHEVTVLTGQPNYPEGKIFADFLKSPKKFANYNGARIIRVPLVARGNGRVRLVLNYLSFAIVAALLGPVKLRDTAFDCIFVFEPSPVTVGIPAIVVRRLRRVPMAFWVQDLWPETLQAIGVVKSPRLLNWIGKFVKSIYNRCDLILAQSQGFIPLIAANCDHPERIKYFPNWAEQIFGALQDAPAPEVPAAKEKFSIMFAGNIGEAQDFPTVLDAAEQLRGQQNIRWLIIGEGRMSDWVAGEIKRRELGNVVQMFGRFPMERMPSFYRHADALLVSLKPDPILAMTIPAKLQTYLAAGIPVLAMIDGEGAVLVEQAGAGLACAAGDADSLASAVVRLSAMSEQERETMGQRGREVTAAEFDRTKQIDKLESWLSKLQYRDATAREAA
jgi:colanic acid biosynthesis glycosyl transferase WcaI